MLRRIRSSNAKVAVFKDHDMDKDVKLMSLSFSELDFCDLSGDDSISMTSSITVKQEASTDARVVEQRVPSICQSVPIISSRSTSSSIFKISESDKKATDSFSQYTGSVSKMTSFPRMQRQTIHHSECGYKSSKFVSSTTIPDERTYPNRISRSLPLFPIAFGNTTMNDGSAMRHQSESYFREPQDSFGSNSLTQRPAKKLKLPMTNKRSEVASPAQCDSLSIDKRPTMKINLMVIVILVMMFLSIGFVTLMIEAGVDRDVHNTMNIISSDILTTLSWRLFGQHLVIESLSKNLESTFVSQSIQIVTLALIGPSGSGKSLTRQIIQDVLSNHGFAIARQMNGKNISSLDNVLNIMTRENRSRNLALIIEDSDRTFGDGMTAASTVLASKHAIHYDKVVVIVVSTVFSGEINNYMFEDCRYGKKRFDITNEDIIRHLHSKPNNHQFANVNGQNGQLRTIVLPFLPLDVDQIKMCIGTELARRGVSKEKWNKLTGKVLNQMDFYSQCGGRFSESGCKLVSSRIDYVLRK